MKYNLFIAKIHLFITLLLVFWMPLSKKYLPMIIVLFVFSWLLEGRFVEKYNALMKSKILIFLIGFFILHVIGIFYSANNKEALFDLEVKMTLLVFPLIIASSNKFYLERKKMILLSFILGCFIASMICIGNAFYSSVFFQEGKFLFNLHSINYWENNFYYTRFSLFLHPSYFSMYLLLAIVFAYFLIKEKLFVNKYVKIVLWLAVPFFILSVILNSSRAGIVCLIVLVITILCGLLKNKGLLLKLSVLIIMIIVFVVIINSSSRFQPLKNLRTSFNTEINPANSSMERLFLWKTSIQVIKNHFFVGVGTGDVKDELIKAYSENNYSFAKVRKYNAHNEFLETFIRLGIIGLLLLILLFVLPIVFKTYQERQLYEMFALIIIINFLFESMLNTISGVVFFAFFYSLLNTKNDIKM